jgi:hypothetical protein
LRWRDLFYIKITHQADLYVGPAFYLNLLSPTPTHFYLSVLRTCAVTDNKMIKEAPHPSSAMIAVKGPGITL